MPAVNGTAAEMVVATAPKGSKREAVEDIYQKKTQHEHILLRPDTYIGSVEKVTELMWVFDAEKNCIENREITYVPGLYKIFDEILVNAADNKQRDPKMDTIKIDIDRTNCILSIYNNGKGIPVEFHKTEKMYVPTMIFGHLLTSSNYNDEEEKVTGGRNGYGAKLANIFSDEFSVETASKDSKKTFKQKWAKNMTKASEPKLKDFTGEDFTRIVFKPDLTKFKMDSLDEDAISLLSRRAYDVAASSRGVKVFLNGKRLPVKGFKDYVELFIKDKEDDTGNAIKVVYEQANEHWEVAVTQSDKGFQQMSFVNSIATTKGGRHTDYITDMVVKNLLDSLKKKNKSGVNIKPFQVKNHLWVFVNCLLVNPTFDSQTKENMTLPAKSFKFKCVLSEKFSAAVVKSGIVESVLTWAKFKQEAQLQKKCDGKKKSRLKDIPKLEDANDAGTKNSLECTLILTEGDSAKSLAVAGLGVVGRDRYGVFPLKGKLLNVREASHAQILQNVEINALIKILGLQYKKKYDSSEDMKSLRYGRVMIMTDQDQDGSHIKGLLINFVHHNWPSLLRHNFLEEFITPIVKASKGTKEMSFYSLPEFDEWKKSTDNWHTYKVKYYKGLGTSTAKEAKEYFHDMARHRIKFRYTGAQDDHTINMAFSKKCVEQRKEWLSGWMEENKRRNDLGLPEVYLYEKNTKQITFTDFVNLELVLFSNLDNERSIPSMVDGLKPGQRKVIFTCIKRNDKREVKVAQLAGSVAEHSAYHHGEASLMATIINLAQNFVGSNNINLLQPNGQFGTRLQGGKDSASPRYIFTLLSPLARMIFHPHDDAVLRNLYDDNQKIEPEWYLPILPMVLVNGAEGIGTGWSTKVPNYNPREIVQNIKRMLRGEDPVKMVPWFKNFHGLIEEVEHQKYAVMGEISRINHYKFEITELPLRVWTQAYKETVMEPLYNGSEKAPSLISEYKEYHTDTTVRFVITIPEDKIDQVENDGFHRVFKLQTTFSTSTMVLFDHNGVLKKYENVDEILHEFYDLRLKYYGKRKAYLVGMLEAEANKLSNQARFIMEKCDGRLTVENKKRKMLIEELVQKGYESDPVKAWKKMVISETKLEEEEDDENTDNEEEEKNDDKTDFDYLVGMAMWSLTEEKKNQLLKQRDEKVHELNCLKRKSQEDLWTDDLDAFLVELDRVETQEEKDDSAMTKSGKASGKLGAKGIAEKRGIQKLKIETMPSPQAQRIVPFIDPELRKRVEKAILAKGKVKRPKKEVNSENDELDSLLASKKGSLANRIGNSPELIAKKAKEAKKAKADGLKQSKLDFKKGSPKKRKGKDPWDSDVSDEKSSGSESDMDVDVLPRQRAAGERRVAAVKAKYKFDEDESDSSDASLHDNDAIKEDDFKPQQLSFIDSPIVVKKAAPKTKPSKALDISDTDSEFEASKPKAKPTASATAVERLNASDMFDSLVGSPPSDGSSPSSPTKPITKRPIEISSDEDTPEPKPKKKPAAPRKPKNDGSPKPKKKPAAPKKPREPKAAAKPKAKKPSYAQLDSDSDGDLFPSDKKNNGKKMDDFENFDLSDIAAREKSGRAKKPISYALSDESESDY